MMTRLAAALALVALASPSAAAQGMANCLTNGTVQLLGVTGAPAPRAPDERIQPSHAYAVTLLASRAVRMGMVQMTLSARPMLSVRLDPLTAGQTAIVQLGRLPGPLIGEATVRDGLKVLCVAQ